MSSSDGTTWRGPQLLLCDQQIGLQEPVEGFTEESLVSIRSQTLASRGNNRESRVEQLDAPKSASWS